MFSLIKWIVKFSIVALVILVLGQALKWNGKSISDQVKVQMAQIERSGLARDAKRLSGDMLKDPRMVFERIPSQEQILPKEREKLRALLKDSLER